MYGNKEEQENLITIKIGDWVTQYSAGYWQVVKIFPKYADEDYCRGDFSWKKGDRIGEWVILKKGFTTKMKPRNDCDLVSSEWLEPVSDDVLESIEKIFEENPKVKEKFDKATSIPRPAITNGWLALSDEQAEAASKILNGLPE